MKTPTWIKALAFLRFTVWHDGTEKKFWSYEKALKYKNDVLAESESLNFKGLHVLRGWVVFYCKYNPAARLVDRWISFHDNPNIIINKNIACDGWTAEAEE